MLMHFNAHIDKRSCGYAAAQVLQHGIGPSGHDGCSGGWCTGPAPERCSAGRCWTDPALTDEPASSNPEGPPCPPGCYRATPSPRKPCGRALQTVGHNETFEDVTVCVYLRSMWTSCRNVQRSEQQLSLLKAKLMSDREDRNSCMSKSLLSPLRGLPSSSSTFRLGSRLTDAGTLTHRDTQVKNSGEDSVFMDLKPAERCHVLTYVVMSLLVTSRRVSVLSKFQQRDGFEAGQLLRLQLSNVVVPHSCSRADISDRLAGTSVSWFLLQSSSFTSVEAQLRVDSLQSRARLSGRLLSWLVDRFSFCRQVRQPRLDGRIFRWLLDRSFSQSQQTGHPGQPMTGHGQGGYGVSFSYQLGEVLQLAQLLRQALQQVLLQRQAAQLLQGAQLHRQGSQLVELAALPGCLQQTGRDALLLLLRPEARQRVHLSRSFQSRHVAATLKAESVPALDKGCAVTETERSEGCSALAFSVRTPRPFLKGCRQHHEGFFRSRVPEVCESEPAGSEGVRRMRGGRDKQRKRKRTYLRLWERGGPQLREARCVKKELLEVEPWGTGTCESLYLVVFWCRGSPAGLRGEAELDQDGFIVQRE
ncbi:hypothetical protein FQN60_013246 [Etheostoma spectabile]|uniref:Uncharacterized protein n=1 Tax=Etheostoma spectabile TaxID=54343 RepID=A0A5J5DCV7_9PERO|nr:hypothetical protein FQN60_013246 [Etheostoma spectabile]